LQQNAGLAGSRDGKSSTPVLKEQLDGVRDLAREGHVARNICWAQATATTATEPAISEDINMGRGLRMNLSSGCEGFKRQQEYQRVRTGGPRDRKSRPGEDSERTRP
jgi:protease secretion system membrane fusion protein